MPNPLQIRRLAPRVNTWPLSLMVIAHRGRANLYPEDSLQAMVEAANAGQQHLEMDAWLLSDGSIAVMHDSTVDRTTSGTGTVTTFTASTWAALTIDGSSWLGGGAIDAAPPLLSAILSATSASGATYWIECKHPAVGAPLLALINGSGIAKSRFVVCSFTLSDLAQFETAGIRTQYLTGDGSQLAAVSATATRIVAMAATVSLSTMATWAAAGFRVQIYTVDRRYIRDGLPAHYDIISNDPSYIRGSLPLAAQDSWADGKWMPGMIAANTGVSEDSRGRIFAGGWYGWSNVTANAPSVLQGWACPIKGNPAADDFTLDFCFRIAAVASADATRWGSVFIADDSWGDQYFQDSSAVSGMNGYHILTRRSGLAQIYKVTNGASTLLQTYTGSAFADNEEVRFKIIVTPTTIRFARVNVATGAEIGGVTATDSTYRGGYFHLSRHTCAAQWRNFKLA